MSSEAVTLLGVIRQHSERPLLIQGDEQLTPSALVDAALKIRSAYPELENAGVALQFSDNLKLLITLLAMDGFAAEILLLPPCLADTSLEYTISATGVSWLFRESGPTALAPEPAAVRAHDATHWLFTTSGTTGTPKVFSHTLSSLLTTTRPARGKSRESRWGLAYQPHRFAGIQVVLQTLVSGSVLVMPAANDINSMVESFVGNGVNTLSATPSQWRNFLSHGGLDRCPLRQITLGGEIADQAILSALAHQFPAARIVHIYASTEAGVGFSVADGKAGFPEAWLGRHTALELGISDSGSLLIKSPAISHSESLRPRLTPDGFLDTEDGVETANGRVYFLGRVTGIINVGGNKVHPEEVENVVREVPGVRNALVRAKNNPIMGQLVLLEVQADGLSAEEAGELKRRIRDHCRALLPAYKVPALITVVDELAVSDSGKIERKKSA